MGWTSEHRDRGISDRDFWQARLDKRYRILDCATIGRTVFYAAIETTEGPEQGKVGAFVVLQHWAPNDYYNFTHKDMGETSGPSEASCPARILDLLSPLPECVHPETYCALCDSRIWEFGGQWVSVARPGQVAGAGGPRCYSGFRAPSGWTRGDQGPLHEPGGMASCCTCWARSWRDRCREVAGNRERAARVTKGQVIKFARPVRFASGAELDTLTFEARDTFRAGGRSYRISGWREMSGWELAS